MKKDNTIVGMILLSALGSTALTHGESSFEKLSEKELQQYYCDSCCMFNWQDGEEIFDSSVLSTWENDNLLSLVNAQTYFSGNMNGLLSQVSTMSLGHIVGGLTPAQVDFILSHALHEGCAWEQDWSSGENIISVTTNVITRQYISLHNESCSETQSITTSVSKSISGSWSVGGNVSLSGKLELANALIGVAGIGGEVGLTTSLSGSIENVYTEQVTCNVAPRSVGVLTSSMKEITATGAIQTAAFYFSCPQCPFHNNQPYTYDEGLKEATGSSYGNIVSEYLYSETKLPPCI